MEKILYLDETGRLYIPRDIRKILQSKILLVRAQDKGIFLESIEEDPIEALAKLGKDKLKGKSIKQLKEEARKELEEDAIKKIRRR